MGTTRGKATAILLISQVLFVVLFGVYVDYADVAGPKSENGTGSHEPLLELYYPMFQDIHVMLLVGTGLLITYLAYHGFGSVGFNFLLTCYVIEWATLVNGWFKMIGNSDNKIRLDIVSIMEADFAVAPVLISMAAVLGKASFIQLLVMATLEVVFYNISLYVGVTVLKAFDVGGAIFIHAFGAYFGLAVARVIYKKAQTQNHKETSVYHSDIFSMIGTVFLWTYWPSFNAGLALGNERHRAVINTILCLSSSTVATFAISAVVNKNGKIDMVHVQNATLAGGVIMGASANLIVYPFGCLLAGIVAATVSTLGYKYLQPILTKKLKIHDTCGVHNLHGMPGILGAVMSAIICAVASRDTYQGSYDVIFSARPAQDQGPYQIAALAVVLAIATVSGALTGLLLKFLPGILDELKQDEYFTDEIFWETVEDKKPLPAPNNNQESALQVRQEEEETAAMAQTQC